MTEVSVLNIQLPNLIFQQEYISHRNPMRPNKDDSLAPSTAIQVFEGSNDSNHPGYSACVHPTAQNHSFVDLA